MQSDLPVPGGVKIVQQFHGAGLLIQPDRWESQAVLPEIVDDHAAEIEILQFPVDPLFMFVIGPGHPDHTVNAGSRQFFQKMILVFRGIDFFLNITDTFLSGRGGQSPEEIDDLGIVFQP